MIYLFPIWLFGFALAIILQCLLRKWPSHVSAFDALTIVFFALVWPAVLTVAVVTIVADTIHFLIEVAKNPH